MAAHPKNKITRAERGKRRRGNTPKLLKGNPVKTPIHKKGLFERFAKIVAGAITKPDTKANKKNKTAKTAKTDKAASAAPVKTEAKVEAAPKAAKAPAKKAATKKPAAKK
jgi:DNA-binding protein HU-beta